MFGVSSCNCLRDVANSRRVSRTSLARVHSSTLCPCQTVAAMRICCALFASNSLMCAVPSKQLKPSEEKQSEDGDDDGDHDDTDDDADDDAEIDVPQSDNYEHGHTEAAVVDADTSD